MADTEAQSTTRNCRNKQIDRQIEPLLKCHNLAPKQGLMLAETSFLNYSVQSQKMQPEYQAFLRGQERGDFRWGRGRGRRERKAFLSFSSLPFSLPSFPFSPKTPDTQATEDVHIALSAPPAPATEGGGVQREATFEGVGVCY